MYLLAHNDIEIARISNFLWQEETFFQYLDEATNVTVKFKFQISCFMLIIICRVLYLLQS